MTFDILLCDLDAFFASVEQRDHPEYAGKPVIVGGRAEARGVVSTCSYEARKFGVHSAMPTARAARLCPGAIFLPVDMDLYRRVSAQVFSIYARYTDHMEKVSIDEAYLAVPQRHGLEIAREIYDAVRQELNLPVSIGVGGNKILAKMACDLGKPGLRQLRKEDLPGAIWPLPVSKLHGIGPKTENKLKRAGIKTIGQLAGYSEDKLAKMFGVYGPILRQHASGIDNGGIPGGRKIKSIGEETTFISDIFRQEEVLAELLKLTGQVGYRLRKRELKAKTVSIKLRFADFTTITRARTLNEAIEGDGAIYKIARDLFIANCGRPPWRLVGVQLSKLDSHEQMSLIQEKDEKLSRAVDGLKDKYGMDAVKRAVLLRPSAK